MPTQDTQSQIARKINFAIQLLCEAADLPEASDKPIHQRRSRYYHDALSDATSSAKAVLPPSGGGTWAVSRHGLNDRAQTGTTAPRHAAPYRSAESFAHGFDEEGLRNNLQALCAVIRSREIISEASRLNDVIAKLKAAGPAKPARTNCRVGV